MGAWGAGSFENDAALDFVDEIDNLNQIVTMLEKPPADDDGFVDEEGEELLVAAEIVAAMLGRPDPYMPEELAGLVAEFGDPSAQMLQHARDAVALVRDNSDLAERWGEDEEVPHEWLASLADLLTRLDPDAEWTPPPAPEPVADGGIGFVCVLCDTSGVEADKVTFTIEDDTYGIVSSFTVYGHRNCVEEKLEAPHFNEDGSVHNNVLEQVDKYLNSLVPPPDDD